MTKKWITTQLLEMMKHLMGTQRKKNLGNFYMQELYTFGNVFRINSVLQEGRLSLVEGYKELVRQDSSLMPLESSRF